MASEIVVNESKTSLNKDERHVLIVSVISLLISKSNEEIKRMLDPNDKLMQELSQLMTVTAWKTLIDTFPTLKDHMSLLTGGEIRKECTRVLGELTRSKNHFPVAERTEAFIAKLTFIEELFKKRQIALGKRKEPSQTSGLQKIPRVTAQRSFAGAAKAGAPPVFMLSRQAIEFDIHTGRLGEGAFAYASKCKVHDTNFPDEWYVCKVIKMAEAGTPKDYAAALESTSIHICHRGLVNPIGLCRDENQPMIIYRYWNGGNLRNWWWTCRADGTTAPPTHFISISTGEGQKARVQKYIFHIVNALMQTMEYMHENNLLHNDFHAGNVFLLFSTATDDVFAGIGDWGRSTSTLTTKHAVPLFHSVERESQPREKHVQIGHGWHQSAM